MDSNIPERLVDNPTFRYFLEEAALWRRTQAAASDVVDAAVQSLLVGVDSPTFVLIAGLTKAEAERELGELLPDALDELGVDCLGHDDPNNDVLAAAALARAFLFGHLEAQQLTQAVHETFGHSGHPLVDELSNLDDSFETLGFLATPGRVQLVRETHSAATSLLIAANEIYSNAQR